MKCQLLKKLKCRNDKIIFLDAIFIMLINVKIPIIVGILTFMRMINFILSWVEYEDSSITSGRELKNTKPVLN